MKTLTEDYVSFKTAVLLKEKGFPQSEYANTLPYYTQNKNLYFGDINTVRQRFYNEAIAPSQSIALKWLREVHKLDIDVSIEYKNSKKVYYYSILKKTVIRDIDCLHSETNFDSYEEACEAAFDYVLKNLI